jgi:presenilin-like A22 family membrane protease
MKMKRKTRFKTVYWSILIFIIAQVITFCVISQENASLENNHIYIPPQSPGAVSIWPSPVTPAPPGEVPVPAVGSLGPILIYFSAVIVVLGITLFLVPVSVLRLVLRILFASLFSWGIFIVLIFWLPAIVAIIVSVTVGLSWFLTPRVWLHNLVMILAMVSLGAVFGRLISPWTAMILLLVMAAYDFFAVRFGYMLWMTKKLTESSTLPAFVIPRYASEWGSNLKQSGFTRLVEDNPLERKYSILGGGDIGFPLLLVSSVFFAYGLTNAILVAGFSFVGLIGAYWIQAVFLKGKPMPALPPIAVLSLIGILIIR